MSSSLDGFSLHVTITIAPENVKPFLEALKPCFDAVAAEKECTFIEIFQDQERPGVFRYVENWSKPKEWVMEVCHVSSTTLLLQTASIVTLSLQFQSSSPSVAGSCSPIMWDQRDTLGWTERGRGSHDLLRTLLTVLLQHQLTKPYYKPYMEATEPMFIEPRKVEIFQRLPRFEFVKAKEENFKD